MLTKNQIEFIKSLNIKIADENNISDDEYIMIEETVGDCLALRGFDKDYNINDLGIMCESILDSLD